MYATDATNAGPAKGKSARNPRRFPASASCAAATTRELLAPAP
jgi:hypothetical protein